MKDLYYKGMYKYEQKRINDGIGNGPSIDRNKYILVH